jgi:hypothetical protein
VIQRRLLDNSAGFSTWNDQRALAYRPFLSAVWKKTKLWGHHQELSGPKFPGRSAGRVSIPSQKIAPPGCVREGLFVLQMCGRFRQSVSQGLKVCAVDVI